MNVSKSKTEVKMHQINIKTSIKSSKLFKLFKSFKFFELFEKSLLKSSEIHSNSLGTSID